MSDVEISRCGECAWQGTPLRLWCPACGGEQIESVVVTDGRIAEVTTVRHVAGGAPAPIEVASIEVDGGGTLIARRAAGEPGVHVRLADDRGAPVATPAEGDET